MIRHRIITILLFVCIGVLYAHSGRTDKYGGHNNRKTGGYHYHNAGSIHHRSNPFQNHKSCGICYIGPAKPVFNTDRLEVIPGINSGDKDMIMITQSCLKYLGYDIGIIDGNIGDKTTVAINSFQRSKGLTVTGRTDPITTKLLLIAILAKVEN